MKAKKIIPVVTSIIYLCSLFTVSVSAAEIKDVSTVPNSVIEENTVGETTDKTITMLEDGLKNGFVNGEKK